MVRGFYQLGSGMMTGNKILNSVSNNIANAKTAGYKRQEVVTSSFETMLVNRVDSQRTPLGNVSMFNAVSETATIHTMGNQESTGRALDFSIQDNGFFAVQSEQGVIYTRKGNFNVDDQGFLILSGLGRVLGSNGAPIQVGTDDIAADSYGNLFVQGNMAGQLGVFDFADYNNLNVVGEGLYTGGGAALVANPKVAWQTLEGSNVDSAQEMTTAIAAQRGLQSCSQILKMYDQILAKATNDIGRLV